jgi:hypothetical protein
MLATRPLILLAALLLPAACDRAEPDDTARGAEAPADAAAEASAPPAAPGDVAITSRGGKVVLALEGDSVVMRLSDSVLAEVRAKTDTTGIEGRGLAASFEKMVKGTVQRALSHRLALAVDDIEEIERDGDAIRIRARGHRTFSFEDVNVNDRPALESFARDDADRFVEAVRARMAQR